MQQEGFDVVAVSSPGKDLDDLAMRENVRVHAVPMHRRITPLKDVVSLWRLCMVIRQEHPDIIHSFTPKAGLLSMIAGWICRVPHRIHTFTGLVFPTSRGLKRKLLKFTDFLTCYFATDVLAEGNGIKKEMEENRIHTKHITVLGYGSIVGVDIAFFDNRLTVVVEEASKIRKSDVFTFVFIGRQTGDKGVNELIEAFVKVSHDFPLTRLILVGETEPDIDPLKPSTIETIEKMPSIETVPWQKDVRPWLAASDVLVLPSYREGFPNVVLEAGAMELPCIVSDVPGSNDIIADGDNGILVPSKDVEALDKAMRQALDNKDKIREMGRRARRKVEHLYTRDTVFSNLVAFYLTLYK